MKFAIVGAGITGLTTAHLLLRSGAQVDVYESSATEGGLAGTFASGEFHFDFGPHEFVTRNEALVTLLTELCGTDLVRVTKRTAQHFNGRFVRYPFEIGDVVRSMPLLRTMRAVLEVAWGRLRNAVKPPRDTSFEDWTRARFGDTFFDHYFGPYTEKVWGLPPSQIDKRTAAHRISVDSLFDLVKKTLAFRFRGGERHGDIHSEFWREFLYTRGGAGTLQRHLRRHVEAAGGRFHFGKRLASMRVDEGRATALTFRDGSTVTGFDAVVSTIPLPDLLRVALGAEADGLLAANDLPFRGMVFVFLKIGKPKVTENHWIYFPDPKIPFQRWTEFGHFEADMTPAGCTGLALEVAATPGTPDFDMPDAEQAERCIRAIVEMGLITRSDVLGYDVVRVRHAYPVQVIGYQERADALLAALRRVENLVSIGRQGLFRYCNQNECMEMAMDVVPMLLRGERSIVYTNEGTWRGVALTDRPSRESSAGESGRR